MNRRGAEAQRINELTEKVIGICIDIHRQLGPGLFESVYSACLCLKLDQVGLRYRRKVRLPVEFESLHLDAGYHLDILVEELVILELKAVREILPVHEAQLLTYLKLTNLPAGLLINFNVPLMKNGIRRLVNNLVEPSAPPRLRGPEKRSRTPKSVASQEVEQLIPHREPFLFVDRIVECEDGRIVTERKVRADEPQFKGHYPGSPLMPGVLLCEACFQTGAMLLRSAGVPPTSSFLSHSTQIDKTNRGYLPHWNQDGATYFVTFRLADALPDDATRKIEFERRDIVKTAVQLDRPLTNTESDRLDKLYIQKVDDLLNAGHGSCSLKNSACAQIVADAIRHFDGDRYVVYAWCVMPNHVHAVFRVLPGNECSKILHSWKSFTSKACNKVLGRKGEFWQRESFDRIVRDRADFEQRVSYTLDNPVMAGLTNWSWVGGKAVDETSTADAGETPALLPSGQTHALRTKPVLTRILEAKFRGMVVPGDLLRIEVELIEKMGEAYVMHGKVSVAGKNVLRVKFIVAMVEVAK